MSVELKSRFTHKNRSFAATWQGGAYIDVRFGGYSQPTEVINVYDDEKGENMIPFDQRALALALKRWVLEKDAEAEGWAQDNDEPVDDWYAAYVENARYS